MSSRAIRVAAAVLLALTIWQGTVRLLSWAGTGLAQRALPEGWMLIRPPHEVSALALQGDTVWAGGRDGLYAIGRTNGALRPLPAGASRLRYVKALLVDGRGALWIAHVGGLSQYAGGQWLNIGESDGLPAGPALSLLQARDGALWVGGETGVSRRRPGAEWQRFTTADGLGFPEVDVIFQDRGGVIWFGSAHPTRGGLTRFDGRSWRSYGIADGLPHSSVNDITQGSDGAIWVATGFADRGGAARLLGGTWSTLTRRDGLAGEKVRSIFQDRDGSMWFGSEYDGMAILCEGRWTVLTPQEETRGQRGQNIRSGRRRSLLAGHRERRHAHRTAAETLRGEGGRCDDPR